MLETIRNPLVQFLAAGAAIFALHALLAEPEATPVDAVTITRAEQAGLAAMFEKTWKRPPTAEELDGLVDGRIREELFYREALAMGLDEDDVMVRRRMAQKIDFMIDDFAAEREPGDDELAGYMRAHADRYAGAPKLTFRHVYLSPDARGATLVHDARVLLAALGQGADPGRSGDATGLPMRMSEASLAEVAQVFGRAFAKALQDLPLASWSGPVGSAYGAHLVLLEAREKARPPRLAEVRDAVLRDWRDDQRRKARDAYADRLREKYVVRVEEAAGAAE